MQFEHTVIIPAPPSVVWGLTVDVERWPELTSTITSVTVLDPPLRLGGQARIVQPRQGARLWTVTRFEPESCFEWLTSLGPLRMTGRHDLVPVDEGTRNVLTLELVGPGSGVVGRILGSQLRSALATENEGFRRAASGG